MKHLNRLASHAVITVLATVSLVALAQGALTVPKSAAEATTAIDARKNHFKNIKKAYDPMIAMLKRQREIDPAVVATSAAQLQDLAAKIPALLHNRHTPVQGHQDRLARFHLDQPGGLQGQV